MSIDLTKRRMSELEEIVEKMNKEAEMALYYDEGTPQYQHHLDALLSYKEKVLKMEDHERTYVQQGLLDRKDVHDFYWPELDAAGIHQREKMARLDQEGKTRSDEEWRRV